MLKQEKAAVLKLAIKPLLKKGEIAALKHAVKKAQDDKEDKDKLDAFIDELTGKWREDLDKLNELIDELTEN